MCKSIVKLSIIIYLILYICKIDALYIRNANYTINTYDESSSSFNDISENNLIPTNSTSRPTSTATNESTNDFFEETVEPQGYSRDNSSVNPANNSTIIDDPQNNSNTGNSGNIGSDDSVQYTTSTKSTSSTVTPTSTSVNPNTSKKTEDVTHTSTTSPNKTKETNEAKETNKLKEEKSNDKKNEIKPDEINIVPDNTNKINIEQNNSNDAPIDIDNSNNSNLDNQRPYTFGNISNGNSNKGSNDVITDKFSKFFSLIAVIGVVSIGLVAVSSYKVLKRKSENKLLKLQDYESSSMTPTSVGDLNNPRVSLINSLVYDNNQNNSYYPTPNNKPYITEIVNNNEVIEPETAIVETLPYQSSQNDGNTSDVSKSFISVKRSSVLRHSFLNPDLNIIRTGKRTQQLYEATDDHPAIIETFPSMERPFEPSVPVPLEESDVNSLHPHSIYQMYQDDMEYENYYAYTIDDKEYIIDPTTNRVLEIHDLTTNEYMLVEEELYLDFSGSSEDSDSDKQTL